MSVFVVMIKLTNMEKRARVGNVICVPIVRKLSPILLTRSIIDAISILMRYIESYPTGITILYCSSRRVGSSLRGISRIAQRAYCTVVSVVRVASQKAQILHNAQVQKIETNEVITDVPEGLP
jgi:hypothetical protein